MSSETWVEDLECSLQNHQYQRRIFYVTLVIVFFSWSTLVPVLNGMVVTILEIVSPGIIGGDLLNLRGVEYIRGFAKNAAWTAGILEPITSKLIPTIIVIFGGVGAIVSLPVFLISFLITTALFPDGGWQVHVGIPALLSIFGFIYIKLEHISKDFTCVDYLQERLYAAPLGGLVFGIYELYHRNIVLLDGPLTKTFELFFWEYLSYQSTMLVPVIYHVIEGTIVIAIVLSVARSDSNFSRKILVVAGATVIVMALHLVFNTWFQEQGWFWDWWVSVV